MSSALEDRNDDERDDAVVLEHPRQAITEKNRLESPILRLPLELRNKIYSLIRKAPVAQLYKADWGNRQSVSEPLARIVNAEHFALACRQLYYEAAPHCLDNTALKIDTQGSRKALEPLLNTMHIQGYRFSRIKVLHVNRDATARMLVYKWKPLIGRFIQGLAASLFPSLETVVVVRMNFFCRYENVARFCFANPLLRIKFAR